MITKLFNFVFLFYFMCLFDDNNLMALLQEMIGIEELYNQNRREKNFSVNFF